jgi:lipoprotein-anchoring transpeptidase ErfK/SrfK
LICAVGIVAAYSAVTHPALASLMKSAPTQENLWAPMEIAKPAITPIGGSAFALQSDGSTATANPTDAFVTSAPTKTPKPTDVPTEAATFTPGPTETPGVMAMEIVVDTPTNTAPQPSGELPGFATGGDGVRWIDVDLTHQAVYAYEGDVMVNSFIVSTGTRWTPTVTGQYKIYVKYRSAKMSGPGYYLPDVPYIMYFYKGYGLHGTYWHSNFGTPMSHGCVNLRTDDAAWIYNWASVGTVVNVHY